MSEENNNGQANGNGTNDWRAEIEANLARITKRLAIMNKLHLREEFRAAQARKESNERMAQLEKESAVAKLEAIERKRESDERNARIEENLRYLTNLARAFGDQTFELDGRISQAGAILSGDPANRTGT